MSIRNTLHSNMNYQKPINTKYGTFSPQQNSLVSILSSMNPSDSYSGVEGLDSKMQAAKQKMTIPGMIQKLQNGQEFTEAEIAFIKKTKGGIEAMDKAMGQIKSKGEATYINELLDDNKVSAEDRKKMVIEVSRDQSKGGALTISVSGIGAEAAKKIAEDLNSPKGIAHAKNLYDFNLQNSKANAKLPAEFLSYSSADKTKITEYLKANGFTGKLSDLDVKDGKITGLPAKLDTLLNDPKLSTKSDAFQMKKGLLKQLAQDKLNGGAEVPTLTAKLTLKYGSLAVVEQQDVVDKIKNYKFVKGTGATDKLFQNDPMSWYASAIAGKSVASQGVNVSV